MRPSENEWLFPLDTPSSTSLTTDKLNAVVIGNGRIVLTCLTDANPPPRQYRFYHNGVYFQTSLKGKHVIPKAKYSDAGTYLCAPLNSLGFGTNGSVNVSVYGNYSMYFLRANLTSLCSWRFFAAWHDEGTFIRGETTRHETVRYAGYTP